MLEREKIKEVCARERERERERLKKKKRLDGLKKKNTKKEKIRARK